MAAEPNPPARQSSAGKLNPKATIRLPPGPGELLGIALAAAAILLGTQSVLMSLFAHQSVWKTSWVVAAIFMGPEVLHWPAIFDMAAITAALVALYPTSLVCVLILASVVHRLSLKSSIIAGVVLGLLFYRVDLFGFPRLFPWLVQERNWMALLSHLVFGSATAWMLARGEGEVT